MNGPRYACVIDAADAESTSAAQVDFFELTPADDKVLLIHSIFIAQLTEEGDAQDEMLGIEIRRGGTGMTSGSGGNAAAAGVGLRSTAPTSGFTFESMNTTLATFTSGLLVLADGFNVRTGWQFRPTPEERISVSQANGGLVVRLQGAPNDAITWTGTMIVEEISG